MSQQLVMVGGGTGTAGWSVGVGNRARRACDAPPGSPGRGRPRPAAARHASTARAGQPTSRPAAGSARLTRRGRLLLVLTVSALLLAAFSLGRVSTSAVTSPPPQPAQITVASGETLWDVATRIAPDHDPRQIVAQLERLNHLSGPQLVAGQVLLVPRR